ncbi:MAG: thioredoxin [Bacteroidota bacterium]
MKSDFKSIVGGDTTVLVDFYADWCGPCKTLSPILQQVKDELGDTIKIVKVDVDKNPKLAKKYRVQGIPTMLLFKKGIQVWRQSGILQKKDLIQVITSH